MSDECEKIRPLIDSAIDGELPHDRLVLVKQHLAQCPDCAKIHQHRVQMSRLVRTEATRFVPSQDFHDRIRAAVTPPSARKGFSWITGGALGGSVVALAASLALFVSLPGQQEQLAHDLLSAHVRALMGNHLIDVQSSDQHTVKPWFNGKIDLSPPVADLADEGFPLVGGRLDYIDDKTAAALVYRHATHVIDLFTWPQPGADDHGVNTANRNGYFILSWSANHAGYAVVSDLNLAELEDFQRLWRERTKK